MPTYQYRCTDCGEDLEVWQQFSDAPLTECPACGGQLRKVFNAAAVVFKGSGFYKTDSRATGKSGDTAGSDGSKSTNGTGSADAGASSPANGSAGSKASGTTGNGTGSGSSGSGSRSGGKVGAGSAGN